MGRIRALSSGGTDAAPAGGNFLAAPYINIDIIKCRKNKHAKRDERSWKTEAADHDDAFLLWRLVFERLPDDRNRHSMEAILP